MGLFDASDSLEADDGFLDLFEGFILGLGELGSADFVEAVHRDHHVREGEAVDDSQILKEGGDTVEQLLLLVLRDEVEVDLSIDLLAEVLVEGGLADSFFDRVGLVSRDLGEGGLEGHLDVAALALENHRTVVDAAGGVEVEPLREEVGNQFALGGIDGTFEGFQFIELCGEGVNDGGFNWEGGLLGLGLGVFDGGGEGGDVEFHGYPEF